MAKNYITILELANITGYSYGKAGNIIRALNDELKEKGVHTFKGKVSKKYFCERLEIELD